ncbi:Fe/S biogenesis protein NfuA [Buchnera aphidicola (Cinara strobi)]|uniref:Fe/S biogenesis protein NfuA n=2 Tax=Buchnera aphidicola TaxID=9 RepID=A0A3B1DX21_9GAMM|nr:Fe/S biogenesis protein NfuA [Buchnera aphidicola (Cinara strobi)]
MIKISSAAEKYIIQLLSKQKLRTNIRIFVNSPGTMYAECGMSYCDSSDFNDFDDEKISFDKFDMYVCKSMIPFLKDVEINLIQNHLGTQITLKAPYAKLLSKSKKFLKLEPEVRNFLLTIINPNLSLHGGSVDLLGIDNSGIAILKFSGGCNGCSMIDFTLKTSIEKKLIKNFPEIIGVRDITEHTAGKHSYY